MPVNGGADSPAAEAGFEVSLVGDSAIVILEHLATLE
jgi:hypothetical protein